MDTLKMWVATIKSVFAGIGIWIILILCNTCAGEPVLNTVKMMLDVVFAAMIVKSITVERKAVIGVAVVSSIIAFVDPWFEKYTFSSDEGVNIKKGFLNRTYVNIPTNHIRIQCSQFASCIF